MKLLLADGRVDPNAADHRGKSALAHAAAGGGGGGGGGGGSGGGSHGAVLAALLRDPRTRPHRAAHRPEEGAPNGARATFDAALAAVERQERQEQEE